jgi:hypothetical protein
MMSAFVADIVGLLAIVRQVAAAFRIERHDGVRSTFGSPSPTKYRQNVDSFLSQTPREN